MLPKRLIKRLMMNDGTLWLDLYIAKIYNKKMSEILLEECIGFEWDEGNHAKNAQKHAVSRQESEQVFFNIPLLLHEDVEHSQIERRMYILGKTDANRKLFIAFTVRDKLIRVISARDMSKKERRTYEHA